MNAELQRVEVEPAFAGDDEFAIEHTFCGELRAKGIEHLGEVAVQGFLIAALDEDLISIAEYEDAEAVPLGLIDPVAAGRNLIDALCEHRQEGRVDGKIHVCRLLRDHTRVDAAERKGCCPEESQGSVEFRDMERDAKIAALNESFGLPEIARIVSGNGGLPKIQIETAVARGEIYLHGAQMTSWVPAGAEEVLFLSAKSNWSDGKAIRGGVPVCFPWFRAKADDPQAPAHGFVRTRDWRIESIAVEHSDAVAVRFSTGSDDSTKRWWPFDFRLDYRIAVGRELDLELTMKNTGASDLRFEEALHTYFNVSEVANVAVVGLDGATYLDNRDGNSRKQQSGNLQITGQTDNAYLAADAVAIFDPAKRRSLKTAKQNSASTIVWNPWRDGASTLTDLGDDEWRQMLCVEGGNIMASSVTLRPGESHSMGVKISVEEKQRERA